MDIARRFENKVALVTGGGSGIGRAAALRFASEGAKVVIPDLNLASAQKVAHEIQAAGATALAVQANVTQPEDCQRMIAAVQERFGRLDIVFANAGIGGGDEVLKMEPADWDRVIATNLRGVFLTDKYAIPALIQSGGGAIVNMASSMAGWDVSFGGAAYMASKEGVTGLTKSLALQLGGYGIRVNAICPGIIQTHLGMRPGTSPEEWQSRYERFAKRIPLRRVGQPEDVAAAVAFLASDDAQHITGSMLLIDGGQTLQSWSNAPDGDEYPLYT
ncbi:MAG TPA: SDR family NAD(P)-dependent oxidoreductase [Anaerolineae bacterium]|nr:SDR family NAD(P)-dependent oxidoreductase [Anaerolineae bacterium]